MRPPRPGRPGRGGDHESRPLIERGKLQVVDARDLYGLPLERFIEERTALAKELRRRGERDRAAEVATLRKPSVAAWAVNQLVRTQKREVAALFKAGDSARAAQAKLLAGRGVAARLREALDRERDAVNRLVEAAQGLLSGEGNELTQVMLERVRETLDAAALDEEARAQVEAGCLHRELRYVGLGSGGLSGEAPARKAPMRSRAGRSRPKGEIKGLIKAEAEARRAAERAARGVATAAAKRDSAAEALDQAEKALAEAERSADEAEATHRRSRRELEKAKAES